MRTERNSPSLKGDERLFGLPADDSPNRPHPPWVVPPILANSSPGIQLSTKPDQGFLCADFSRGRLTTGREKVQGCRVPGAKTRLRGCERSRARRGVESLSADSLDQSERSRDRLRCRKRRAIPRGICTLRKAAHVHQGSALPSTQGSSRSGSRTKQKKQSDCEGG